MASFSDEEEREAKEFIGFYIDLIENHIMSLNYYLSETATLDWFGQTVKGEKNITLFLKSHASSVRHVFPDASPVSKIGHRDTHVVRYPREIKKRVITAKSSSVVASQEITPPKTSAGSSGNKVEQGQGDGLHNCDLSVSPAKRCRLGDANETVSSIPVKFVSAEGQVEFRKRSSKKLQRETKWARPCKLEMAYSCADVKDSTIHLIIYANNMKCRRNLLKDFDSSEHD